LALRILERPLPQSADEVLMQSAAAEVAIGAGWTVASNEAMVARVRALPDAARPTGDPCALYEAYAAAALTLSKHGDHAAALAAGQAALELTEREPAVRYARGIELGNAALLYYVAGDRAAAESYIRQAIELHRENGDNGNTAVNLANLGELLLDRGDYQAAEGELRSAVRLAGAVRMPAVVAMGLLVEALAGRGAVDEAQALSEEAWPALAELAETEPSLAGQRDRLQDVLSKLSS
jgi:tetratricopeptide (TPR) repeat protein